MLTRTRHASGIFCCGTTAGYAHRSSVVRPDSRAGALGGSSARTPRKMGSVRNLLGSVRNLLADTTQLDDAMQPPHFTCSVCLVGHIMLHLDETRVLSDVVKSTWASHHAIPCTLFPQGCNAGAMKHKDIKACLVDNDEKETLEDYRKRTI